MEGESDGVVVDGVKCAVVVGRDGVGLLTQRADWGYSITLNGRRERGYGLRFVLEISLPANFLPFQGAKKIEIYRSL